VERLPLNFSKLFSPRNTSKVDFNEFSFIDSVKGNDQSSALSLNSTKTENIIIKPFDIQIDVEARISNSLRIRLLSSIGFDKDFVISNWSTKLESKGHVCRLRCLISAPNNLRCEPFIETTGKKVPLTFYVKALHDPIGKKS
jgi:hypothetical protein